MYTKKSVQAIELQKRQNQVLTTLLTMITTAAAVALNLDDQTIARANEREILRLMTEESERKEKKLRHFKAPKRT